jgi:hypothetical protein
MMSIADDALETRANLELAAKLLRTEQKKFPRDESLRALAHVAEEKANAAESRYLDALIRAELDRSEQHARS